MQKLKKINNKLEKFVNDLEWYGIHYEPGSIDRKRYEKLYKKIKQIITLLHSHEE